MRNYMFIKWLIIVLLLTASHKVFARELSPRVRSINMSSRIFELNITLKEGLRYKFATYSNNDEDPEMHLFNVRDNRQVVFNDDCFCSCFPAQKEQDSFITYVPNETGVYKIVVRNSISGLHGEVTSLAIYEDGRKIDFYRNIPLGGVKVRINKWEASNKKKIRFSYLSKSKENGGPEEADSVLYLLKHYNKIISYSDDDGAAFSSQILKKAGSCSRNCYIVGGSSEFSPKSEGKARLLIDVIGFLVGGTTPGRLFTNDADGDELSNELEAILRTDKYKKDTDNDGIDDWIEVYGKGDVLLPWEGSDPRKKDIFIEVDYMDVKNKDNRIVYDFKDDGHIVAENLNKSFNKYGNTNVHIDIDKKLPFKRLIYCEGKNLGYHYTSLEELESEFTPARQGIYHWAVVGSFVADYRTAGIACTNDRFLIAINMVQDNDVNNFIQIDTDEKTLVFMHELGHNLNLSHNGNQFHPATSDIHRSIMNYRYNQKGVIPSASHNLIWIERRDEYKWRYSIDNSKNSPILVWDGNEGCLPPDLAEDSPKKLCQEISKSSLPKYWKNYYLSDCDCTFNEWQTLDYTSNGFILDKVLNGNNYNMVSNKPVIGIAGHIIADSSYSGLNMGKNYGKTKSKFNNKFFKAFEFSANKVRNNKYKTKEITKNYNNEIIKYYKSKGFKEGEDYRIVNGQPILGNHKF